MCFPVKSGFGCTPYLANYCDFHSGCFSTVVGATDPECLEGFPGEWSDAFLPIRLQHNC